MFIIPLLVLSVAWEITLCYSYPVKYHSRHVNEGLIKLYVNNRPNLVPVNTSNKVYKESLQEYKDFQEYSSNLNPYKSYLLNNDAVDTYIKQYSEEEMAKIDFDKLDPSDPIFAQMPWPKETSPKPYINAFSKHMLWRRNRSNGERKLWAEQSLFTRLDNSLVENPEVDYLLPDYITQSLYQTLYERAAKYKYTVAPNPSTTKYVEPKFDGEDSIETIFQGKLDYRHSLYCEASLEAYIDTDRKALENSIMDFYKNVNERKFNDIAGRLFIPHTTQTEICLPGYDRSRDIRRIEPYFDRQFFQNGTRKSYGRITPQIVNIELFGNVAVSTVIETIEVDPANEKSTQSKKKRKNQYLGMIMLNLLKKNPKATSNPIETPAKTIVPKHVLTTMVWRYVNCQWRVINYHAGRFERSVYTPTVYKPIKSMQARLREYSQGLSIKGTDGKIEIPIPTTPPLGLNTMKEKQAVVPLTQPIKAEQPIFQRSINEEPLSMEINTDSTNKKSTTEVKSDAKSPTTTINSSLFVSKFGVIDRSASTSRQTLQALRYLENKQRITRAEKQLLINDMIENFFYEKSPLIETAFDMLTSSHVSSLVDATNNSNNNNNGVSKTTTSTANSDLLIVHEVEEGFEEVLEDFAIQCDIILKKLKKRRSLDDDDEDEEDDVEDDEDEGDEEDEYSDSDDSDEEVDSNDDDVDDDDDTDNDSDDDGDDYRSRRGLSSRNHFSRTNTMRRKNNESRSNITRSKQSSNLDNSAKKKAPRRRK